MLVPTTRQRKVRIVIPSSLFFYTCYARFNTPFCSVSLTHITQSLMTLFYIPFLPFCTGTWLLVHAWNTRLTLGSSW